MMITKLQRAVMEHCISGPDRNWFGTESTSEDGRAFEDLVRRGFATSQLGPFGNETVYSVTALGRKALSNE